MPSYPAKTYTINRRTGKVTVEAIPLPGVGEAYSHIEAISANTVRGVGTTKVFCPLAGQDAWVRGFMASTVSRDPQRERTRDGLPYMDNIIQTATRVEFNIGLVRGGAKNPMNRTAMETTHWGYCGDDTRVGSLVATWPPERVELTVDDTGSMSDELTAVRSALAGFIRTRQTAADSQQRDVVYELITFKDSPQLRLAATADTGAVIGAVSGLSADGGDECPEDSLGAISVALDRLTADEARAGSLVLVTDASPLRGNTSAVIARAQALNVAVHVLLSGDCVSESAGRRTTGGGRTSTPVARPEAVRSARTEFSRLARQTGGKYFYAPDRTADEYTALLRQLFTAAVVVPPALLPTRYGPGAGGGGMQARQLPARSPADVPPDAAAGLRPARPDDEALPRSVPVEITIPAIGVRSAVTDVGVKSDGTIALPPAARDAPAVWYRHLASPGEVGPAVILGHVDDARSGPAVFFRLSQLRPGDLIQVRRADRITAAFRVTAVGRHAKTAFPWREVYGPLGYAGLRLITCGGTFDRTHRTYRDNIVVYATLVGTAPA